MCIYNISMYTYIHIYIYILYICVTYIYIHCILSDISGLYATSGVSRTLTCLTSCVFLKARCSALGVLQ